MANDLTVPQDPSPAELEHYVEIDGGLFYIKDKKNRTKISVTNLFAMMEYAVDKNLLDPVHVNKLSCLAGEARQNAIKAQYYTNKPGEQDGDS